jgi:hypothetical protein
MNEPFRSSLPGLVTFIVIAIAWPSMLAADDADACKLLTPADISKTTGLTVAQGTAGLLPSFSDIGLPLAFRLQLTRKCG